VTPDAAGPPLPGRLIAWRLDRDRYASSWDSGEGAFQLGGRWNSAGTRVVYCALDASTAILEVAVHKGFRAVGAERHVLTSAFISDETAVRFVRPADIPDQSWLEPGGPTSLQQAFGDALLTRHPVVAIPSVVSRNSWNVLLSVPAFTEAVALRRQEAFVLDPRLRPSAG
jgi:RES domain-containing protein